MYAYINTFMCIYVCVCVSVTVLYKAINCGLVLSHI